jgi:hypothetical protein
MSIQLNLLYMGRCSELRGGYLLSSTRVSLIEALFSGKHEQNEPAFNPYHPDPRNLIPFLKWLFFFFFYEILETVLKSRQILMYAFEMNAEKRLKNDYTIIASSFSVL